MLIEAELPDDPDVLRTMLLKAQSEIAERDEKIATLTTAGAEAEAEIARLSGIIKALQRHRFGARSEKLDADQLQLALEEIEAAISSVQTGSDQATATANKRPRKVNRG